MRPDDAANDQDAGHDDADDERERGPEKLFANPYQRAEVKIARHDDADNPVLRARQRTERAEIDVIADAEGSDQGMIGVGVDVLQGLLLQRLRHHGGRIVGDDSQVVA